MPTIENSQTDPAAQAWLKPDQVDRMRTAIVEESADYLATRNDALLGFLYDTGLRVSEAVKVDVEFLDLDDDLLALPADIQKDYPNDNTPSYTSVHLGDETVRTLRMYLANRWRDSPALFPSRQSDRMTTESVRNVVTTAARAAEIRPYTTTGRGEPDDVTPHTFRHSVAYRMLDVEDDQTLYDVTRRLRHASIQTTERVYSHFDRV